MDMTTADPLVGATLDQRYYVESRVAGGGMATVYVAHDLRLDRRVALKVMHSTLAQDPQFVRRFINEAHAVAKLSHPNVVQVYDQGTDQGHVYLAMEYVPGRTLRDLLKLRGRLAPQDALQIMVPVLAGLGAAHQAGMVHRDIKPENVLLTRDGQVKVVDFGLARVVEAAQEGLTKTGTLMGTAAYLAPEQISQSVSDARTDVYACGIMLYELLTGAQPHTGDSAIAVAYQHVNQDVPRPSRVVDGIAPEIDALVTQATERDPRYRPGDAGQFLAAVFDVYPHLAGAAPQPPAGYAPAAALPPAGAAAAAGSADDDSNNTLVVELPDVPDDDYEDYGDDRRERSRGLRYPLIAVAGLLVVLLAGFGWWMAFGRYESVPELVGMSREQAEQQLSAQGLRISVADEGVYSDEAEEGTIAESDPAASARALPGDTVTVALSLGPQTVEMPNVVGLPVSDARGQLEDLGIEDVTEEEASSRDQPAGTVLSSDPEAGADADRAAGVTLTVSAGFDMPDVTGLSQDDARASLEGSGLSVSVTDQASDSVPRGQVISQDPEAGSTVGSGDSVTITVSSGPEQIEIPDVTGWKVDDARKELEELGFRVEVHEFMGDRVAAYSPTGRAEEGATVELWATPFGNGGPGRGNDRGNRDDD
ncbi:Stk1 family PASTA domain-containing Ser/Thr kinase [Marinitenerispora sediminis]|uniref:non-specific serine/threonine protein kinase n=1 Tax=Marinitenerispora sediminis TaxID=1931232 RepID=A0A368TBY3_9ACTN|nr:Stk1 family PASTA domain-containing Ser/Thr kinase [Marinitenerispora sediminis]RCV55279.1 Stk1 family PASTA domain-containing Ser/Thr kinase [Marinitenerispora sediminis]RCV61616.1 Stk1 family PASTA domain-containing Ser/Thr kinase [Marinitenerispora sediminis]RCV62653.1 Stk1 family PASTA domain-containing Ser/Thr kinase [Marinitenerispora sediminis]